MYKELSPSRKVLYVMGVIDVIVAVIWVAFGIGCLANSEFASMVVEVIDTSLVAGMKASAMGIMIIVAAVVGLVMALVAMHAAKKPGKPVLTIVLYVIAGLAGVIGSTQAADTLSFVLMFAAAYTTLIAGCAVFDEERKSA